MRSFDRPTDPRPTEPRPSGDVGTTIRLADYQTRPTTRTSWAEVQIHREEIRLPHGRRDERR
jgi:hypothetical protein